ncbi:hypothetical protein [Planomonospora parontospora]|uniref:hypothetical protein n=1 Tax=Planomonospora parontospora TaxID=58119 RepID=UPI00166FC33C|nr:hypothetical protein [Planomonospora parontospora]GGL57545.1 hypothetical protein GCM10014719_68750 [Planomonospora parontospora subsp. antibiotica]GII20071.1 hypothetical protein Ppa05_67970 [Planomonospora parontospora subsp. antibiotica]
MTEFDGVIVGGGRNGLACAARLARTGPSAAVAQRNGTAGDPGIFPWQTPVPEPRWDG